jgi:hypothetical protein
MSGSNSGNGKIVRSIGPVGSDLDRYCQPPQWKQKWSVAAAPSAAVDQLAAADEPAALPMAGTPAAPIGVTVKRVERATMPADAPAAREALPLAKSCAGHVWVRGAMGPIKLARRGGVMATVGVMLACFSGVTVAGIASPDWLADAITAGLMALGAASLAVASVLILWKFARAL